MSFEKLHLNPKLLDGIKQMGFTTPTQIQEKCIPEIKAGKDVVGQSLTGSGKTAAFGLPILEKIIPGGGLQALVLIPTRELCVQVRDNLDQMSKFLPINVRSIYGGVGYYQQKEDILIAEIIVATPGRLLDHINQRNIDLSTIKFVVLDEADKMFEMGFEQDVDKILRHTPKERQTIMFSATMPRAAQNIIHRYLKSPVHIQEKLHVDRSLLKQVYYVVSRDEKFSLLVHLLKEKTAGPAIVFCGTKRMVDVVARDLKRNRIDAMPVHGDLSQHKRLFAVNAFKSAKIDVLVATDVAARGLDIKDVSHVYNYDVPKTPEEYTHRIGRTARAGKKGDAVTLLSERDYGQFERILYQGKMPITEAPLPEFERLARSPPMVHGHSRGSERFHSSHDRSSRGPSTHGGRYGRSPRDHGNRSDGYQSRPREYGRRQEGYGSRPTHNDSTTSEQGDASNVQHAYDSMRTTHFRPRQHRNSGRRSNRY